MLKMMEIAGEITNLEIQPRYEIIPTFKKDGKTYPKRSYVADFRYKNKKGETVVEDVKSPITKKNSVYTIKRHLFLMQNPCIKFVEV